MTDRERTMKKREITENHMKSFIIISALVFLVIFLSIEDSAAQEISPLEQFASEVDKMIKAAGNPGLEEMELEMRIRILGIFLSSQQRFASSDSENQDYWLSLIEEYRESVQFIGLLADYDHGEETMERLHRVTDEIINGNHQIEIKTLTGLESSQIPDLLTRSTSINPDKKIKPIQKVKPQPLTKKYPSFDRDSASQIEKATEKFLTAMKEKQFDLVLSYMAGRPREKFQSMLVEVKDPEDYDKFIPSSWEFLKVHSDDQDITYKAYVKMKVGGRWETTRLRWMKVEGKWKMFEADNARPEEIAAAEEDPEMISSIQDTVEIILGALSKFDINEMLLMTTGKSRTEFVKLISNEEELEQVRKEMQGLKWQILKISFDEKTGHALVDVDVTNRDGKKDSWMLELKKINNVWKLTDSK